MRLGLWLGKPNQLRALKPVSLAAMRRCWDVEWWGPGASHPFLDVMVGVDPPRAPGVPYIWLQAGMDPFHHPALLPTDALRQTVVATYTDWWAAQLPPGVRGVTTGMPLTKTTPGRKNLVYVPWSVRSGSPSRWQRFQNWQAHHRLIRALGAYIEDARVPLVVKTRRKDPAPDALTQLADFVVKEDDGATLGWLHGAWGCVHVYSSVVLEAAALGVPSLCLDPGPRAFGAWSARFCHGQEGGPFNWPGVVEHRPIRQAFSPPPAWAIDTAALERYRAQFVGDTTNAAQNVCDLAESLR